MTSISAVEYMLDGSRVRVSEQLEVEKAVIEENSKRFVLVYKSIIFSKEIIERIGDLDQTKSSQELIFEGKPINRIDSRLTSFLQLLHQKNPT